MNDQQPRGIRNSNPGNIMPPGPHDYQGQNGLDPDGYAKFNGAVWGIRAIFEDLHTYKTRDGCRTLRDIITRWDGSTDSAVHNYLLYVCSELNLTPDEPFVWGDVTLGLVKAIIHYENGQQPYSNAMFASAIALMHC